MNAVDNREQIERIRVEYLTGKITREEAKEQAMPIINAINEKGKELSKKYGIKFSPVTFISLMR